MFSRENVNKSDIEFLETLKHDVDNQQTSAADLDELITCSLADKPSGGGVWKTIKSFFCSKKVVPVNSNKSLSLVSRVTNKKPIQYVKPNILASNNQQCALPYYSNISTQYAQYTPYNYTPIQYCVQNQQNITKTRNVQDTNRVHNNNTLHSVQPLSPLNVYQKYPNVYQQPSRYRLPPIEKAYILPSENTIVYDALTIAPTKQISQSQTQTQVKTQTQIAQTQDPFVFNMDMDTMREVFQKLKNEFGNEAYKAMVNFQVTCKNFSNLFATELASKNRNVLKNNLKNLIEYTINIQYENESSSKLELLFIVSSSANRSEDNNRIFVISVEAEAPEINDDLLYSDVWETQYVRLSSEERKATKEEVILSFDRNELKNYTSYQNYKECKTSKIRVDIQNDSMYFEQYIKQVDTTKNARYPGYRMIKLDVAETVAEYIANYLQQQTEKESKQFIFLTPVINNDSMITENYYTVDTMFTKSVLDFVNANNSTLASEYGIARKALRELQKQEAIQHIEHDVCILLARFMNFAISNNRGNVQRDMDQYHTIKLRCKLGMLYLAYIASNEGSISKEFDRLFGQEKRVTKIKEWFVANQKEIFARFGWRWIDIPEDLYNATQRQTQKEKQDLKSWVIDEIKSWNMFGTFIQEKIPCNVNASLNGGNAEQWVTIMQKCLNKIGKLSHDVAINIRLSSVRNTYNVKRNDMMKYLYDNRNKIANTLVVANKGIGGMKKTLQNRKSKHSRSALKTIYKGKERTVYLGPRGGKYIKLDGKYVICR